MDTPLDGRWSSTVPIERARFRRPSLPVFLYNRLTPAESKDRWVVQLRWLAVGGMSATILIARLLVPALDVTPLLVLVGLVALSNVAWTQIIRRSEGSEHVTAQLTLDGALLTALLWCSGGIANPFIVFLTFQIALAGVLCDGRVTLGVSLLALAAITVLCWAPGLPLDSAALGRAQIEVIGRVASLVSLSVFLGIFALVYARRLADLRDAKARNERLAMLGRLVGGMSHELATPLGTIVLGTHDLVALTRDSHPEASELARAISEEAVRASEILGLFHGQLRPDQRAETVDLAALVEDLAARELDRLDFKGTRIIDAPVPVPVHALRVALGQVLRNLLTNAVHATREAHKESAQRRIEVIVRAEGAVAEVQVIDNGPGFSPSIAERLGEPFQTTKEGSGGLGLGLYVSSMLAQQMRASLRVEDAAGGGARVTLTLGRRIREGAGP